MTVSDTSAPSGSSFPLLVETFRASATSSLPFLDLKFETNPLSKEADSIINLSVQPLLVACRPSTITHVASFFKKPDDLVLEDAAGLASSGAGNLRSYTRTSLEHAVKEHKTVSLHLQLAGPKAIVLGSNEHSALILDLGCLVVSSEFVKIGQANPDIFDANSLYDKFVVKIQDIQALLLIESTPISPALVIFNFFLNPADCDAGSLRSTSKGKVHRVCWILSRLDLLRKSASKTTMWICQR